MIVKQVKGQVEGRTIVMNDDSTPALVKVEIRQATTSPTRLKAVLDIDGLAMPFAVPVLPSVLPDGTKLVPSGYTPEFRLEMN